MSSLRGIALFAMVLVYGAAAETSTSTSSAARTTHTVAVGAQGFNYTPASITANVGDIVSFHFYPQNHSVARSAYKQACIPYEDTGINLQGFWSGFEPVAVVLSDPPKFDILINDTEPIFFYCSAPGACDDEGMVGAINPNATQTLEIQREFALNSTVQFSPGEYFPAETSSGASSPTSISSSTSTHAGSSGSASHKDLGTGAIVGIAIGGAAGVIMAGLLFYLCGRQKTMREFIRNSPSLHHHNSRHRPSEPMIEAQYATTNNLKSPTATNITSPSLHPSPYADDRGTFTPTNMNPAWGYSGYPDHRSPSPGSPPPPGYTSPTFSNVGALSEMGENEGSVHGGARESGIVERATGTEVHELGDSEVSTPAHRSFSFNQGNAGYVQAPKNTR